MLGNKIEQVLSVFEMKSEFITFCQERWSFLDFVVSEFGLGVCEGGKNAHTCFHIVVNCLHFVTITHIFNKGVQ